jgi:hypothetical protein
MPASGHRHIDNARDHSYTREPKGAENGYYLSALEYVGRAPNVG